MGTWIQQQVAGGRLEEDLWILQAMRAGDKEACNPVTGVLLKAGN